MKKFLALLLSMTLLLSVLTACSLPSVSDLLPFGGKSSSEDEMPELDDSYVEWASCFSKKQNKQLTKLKNEAYKEEWEFLPTYIEEAASQTFMLTDHMDIVVADTEAFYDAVTELDPGLSGELTSIAESRYGYAAGKGVQALLRDDEIGQYMREGAAWGAAILFDLLNNMDEPETSPLSLMPVAVNGGYVLYRTYGPIYQMKNVYTGPYSTAISNLNDYLNDLQSAGSSLYDEMYGLYDIDPKDKDAVSEAYELYAEYCQLQGRLEAVKDKRVKLAENEALAAEEFMTGVGLELDDPDQVSKEWKQYVKDRDLSDVIKDEDEYDYYWDQFCWETGYSLMPDEDDYYDEDGELERDEYISDLQDYACDLYAGDKSTYLYYIADMEDNIYSAFTTDIDYDFYSLSSDGTAGFWKSGAFEMICFNDGNHIVVSRDGELMYQDEVFHDDSYGYDVAVGSVIYSGAAPCGNVLRFTLNKDFEYGTYYQVDIVTPKGKTIPVLKSQEGDDGDDNYYQLGDALGNSLGFDSDEAWLTYYDCETGERTACWVNMTDGTTMTEEEYAQQENAASDSAGDEAFDGSYTKMGENYYKDGVLYTAAGRELYTFDLKNGDYEGGVYYSEGDGVYWVSTYSGYVYLLDSSFDQILEPFEGSLYKADVNALGALVPSEWTDESGETVDGYILYRNDGTEELAFRDFPTVQGTIIGDTQDGWYNVATRTELYIPEYDGTIQHFEIGQDE